METTEIRYNFDEVIDRSGTNCLKYDLKSQFMPESPEDALPLWVADMDFACAPEIINAMHERIDRKYLDIALNKLMIIMKLYVDGLREDLIGK